MSQERIPLRQQRDLSQIIESSFELYTQNFAALFLIAAVSIPLAIASAVVVDGANSYEAAAGLLSLFTFAQLLVDVIVSAALIAALQEINSGKPANFSLAYDVAFARFWTIIRASVRVAFHVLLFAITIVGIPWAIQRAVRWLFIEQAVILDSTSAKAALSYSADAVIGRWWRTLGIAVVIWIIRFVPASVVSGVLFLAPVLISGTLSAIVSAAMLPFSATALTMLYMDLKVRKETEIDASPA
ncbi:MAG: hypothetical protein WBD55_05555 [Dehalococcoidia bacterium]